METGPRVRDEEGLRLLVATLAEENAQLERALAFQLLRAAARSHRIRVHDLAGRVLESPATPSELRKVAPR